MKKYFIFAAAALVSLAACSKVNTLEVSNVEEDAIGFDAYTMTPATKGKVVEVLDVINPTKGIGVFAFYQPSASGKFNTKKFATPDFMYNQQVLPHYSTADVLYADASAYSTAKGISPAISDAEFDALDYSKKVKTAGTVDYWTYSPIKYWPNNSGDKVSFFAYAPYNTNKTWEDMGISTDINATKMNISFPVYDIVGDQVDYLWADPSLNQTKPDVSSKISFAFTHVMSQINLFAAACTDDAGTTPIAWTDNPTSAGESGTTITIDKVEFKGLAKKMNYEYNLTGTPSLTPTPSSETQDIILTAANDFENNTSAAWADDASFHKFNKSTSVMFVAPQALKNVVITYTVKTTDKTNSANNSEITNVITTDMSTVLTLAAGKAYNINFLIGMTSVKVTATVTDWASVADTQVNVPQNS